MLVLYRHTDAVEEEGQMGMTMSVSSNAFRSGGMIPKQYTCDGRGVSPALAWTGVPENAASVAVTCDDPDSTGDFVHWVIFNLPPDVSGVSEGVPPDSRLADGAVQGTNSFGHIGYGGPCPPRGSTHHYVFTVYALDADLTVPSGASRQQVLDAMRGHLLATGELVGIYTR